MELDQPEIQREKFIGKKMISSRPAVLRPSKNGIGFKLDMTKLFAVIVVTMVTVVWGITNDPLLAPSPRIETFCSDVLIPGKLEDVFEIVCCSNLMCREF